MANVNDFVTTAGNGEFVQDEFKLFKTLDLNEGKVVNKDLVGLPVNEGIYNEETGKIEKAKATTPASTPTASTGTESGK